MSLSTCRKLTAKSWIALPIPQDVIYRVHNLSRIIRAMNGLTFKFRSHLPMLNNDTIDAITAGVDEDEDNLTYQSSDDDDRNSDSNSNTSYDSN